MRCRALDGVLYRVAATSLAAGLVSVAVAGASVEVRGSIRGQSDAGPLDVSLVAAPALHELLNTVLRDEPSGFGAAEATVQASDGRFELEVAEPGVRWVRVQGPGTPPRTWLLVGPETDTLLPPLELAGTASCSLTLVEPESAWVARGRSLRDLRLPRAWSRWPPLRRLQAGKATRHEFDSGRSRRSVSGVLRDYVALTIGAPGYEPKVVDCLAGASIHVELERLTDPIADGVLRRDGAPVPAAILVRADGWPAGTTDEAGRYRVPTGAYQVLDADGGLDGIELNGGAADLTASAPQPVAVTLTGVGRGRDELPTVAVVHWSSSGVPLAFNRGPPESATFLVGAGPGVPRTTVLAERFEPLRITWSARPAGASLEPLRGLRGVVLNAAGDPVVGAQVVVSGFAATAGPAGVSDGAGRFLVEVAAPLDRRWLVASASGYRETRTRLSELLDRTAADQLAVELAPVRAIVGRLYRPGAAVAFPERLPWHGSGDRTGSWAKPRCGTWRTDRCCSSRARMRAGRSGSIRRARRTCGSLRPLPATARSGGRSRCRFRATPAIGISAMWFWIPRPFCGAGSWTRRAGRSRMPRLTWGAAVRAATCCQ